MHNLFHWISVLGLVACTAWCAEPAPVLAESPLLAGVETPERTPPAVSLSRVVAQQENLLDAVAQDLASVALTVEKPDVSYERTDRALPLDGRPGDVRLVVTTTDLAARKRWLAPKIPLPPFIQWGQWMDAHRDSTHCSLDWMDAQGAWWHTELRAYNHHPAQYRVGEGEFPCTGITIYGIFILPGRTHLEDHDLVSDERIEMDYRLIDPLAREYGRKDKEPGDPGTGGNGARNVGLGGPAFKPSQNSNTYISYLLRRAGLKLPAPPRSVGWNTKPHFPYSSDATE